MWTLLLMLVIMMTVLYMLATRGAKRTIRNQHGSPCFLRHGCSHTASQIAKKELRVVHLFGFLLFFFSAAYLLIVYINLCMIAGASEYAPPVVEVVSRYLLLINSVINPILCILLSKSYYRTLRNFTRKAMRTRSGNSWMFVPTSRNVVRRKVLGRMMWEDMWNNTIETSV